MMKRYEISDSASNCLTMHVCGWLPRVDECLNELAPKLANVWRCLSHPHERASNQLALLSGLCKWNWHLTSEPGMSVALARIPAVRYQTGFAWFILIKRLASPGPHLTARCQNFTLLTEMLWTAACVCNQGSIPRFCIYLHYSPGQFSFQWWH